MPLLELDVAVVPVDQGVYAVVRYSASDPEYEGVSRGGHFEGRDPSVGVSVLSSRWVPATPVLYLGKANNLRQRLRQFRDFGRGKPIGHWGGRYLWQLADCDELAICWRVTVEDSRSVERELISSFRARFGSLPYANISA